MHALTDQTHDDFFIADELAGTLADDFDLPALALGVTRVHAIKITREQCGLVPAGARADLQKDVAAVEWIGRQQEPAYYPLERLLPRRGREQLFFRPLPHLGVEILHHLARSRG